MRFVVEKEPVYPLSWRLEYRLNLSFGDAGEALEECVNSCAIFQVLKECSDRHSRPLKDPSAGYFLGIA